MHVKRNEFQTPMFENSKSIFLLPGNGIDRITREFGGKAAKYGFNQRHRTLRLGHR